jgi:SAM-dependent methyltransferase
VKKRQQATWASGDFAVIGTTLQIVGEQLAEAANVRAGDYVVDVAAGNGNATLAAARRFARVVSTDYVPQLLERGAQRAKAEGLDIHFQRADAEALPFEDATFDVALSTFGAMFTPDHARASRELLRVVRSGGRIGLANWTSEGFIGKLFSLVAARVPPPVGTQSPMLWGSKSRIAELFCVGAADIQCTYRNFNFRYLSAAHWIAVFRQYYGPTRKAFLALDADGEALLTEEIFALLEALNVDSPHSLVIPAQYLEVVITKR